jgi:hypothetical protein
MAHDATTASIDDATIPETEDGSVMTSVANPRRIRVA